MDKVRDALLDRISLDAGYDRPRGIVVGFLPACAFVEPGEIISNLAYVLSTYGVVVCAVDFKVFYPDLFDWIGGASADRKGEGLIRLLNSDRTEVRSIARESDDKNVFLA